MQCIFCKADSGQSKSVEHIIPESLGNIEHTLPPGVVCDKCNNYFSREVEKPLLESHYFLYARFENLIPSKRGRIPAIKGWIPQLGSLVEVEMGKGCPRLYLDKKDTSRFLNRIAKGGTLLIPHPTETDTLLLSRFLGKVAIEVLAHRVLDVPQALQIDVVDNKALDPLRDYVRYGNISILWTFHHRPIYPADAMFYSEENATYYDIPHEFTLLYTDKKELFLILAIFGIEYAFNLAERDISGYLEWLNANGDRSPLYMDGMNYSFTRGSIAGLNKGSIITVYTRE